MSSDAPLVNKACWISEEIFDWQLELNGGSLDDEVKAQRAYELFAHAETLIRENKSPLSLTDGILSLKRAINHRVKLLDELYQLSSIFPKNTGALERLAIVGLSRPFMIKQLFELRNDIEHNDQKPPSITRCHELVDITWYFLKATDAACLLVRHHALFTCDKGPFAREPRLWIEGTLNNKSQLSVSGWIDTALLSERASQEFLELQINELKCKQDFVQWQENHIKRQKSERWFSGTITLNSAKSQHYLTKIFSASP